MIKEIQQWVGRNQVWIIRDEGNDRLYARTSAGVGWPSERPGAVVAIGEGIASPPFKPEVHVLDVFESADIEHLLLKVLEWRTLYKCSDCFANTRNASAMKMMLSFNQMQEASRGKTAMVRLPPSWTDGSIGHYLGVVRMGLAPTAKQIFLGEHQRIAQALSDVPANSLASVKDTDSPLLAAFAFVCCYAISQPRQIEMNEDTSRAKTDYDIWKM